MVPSPASTATVDVSDVDASDADAVLRALANSRRRHALAALAENEGVLSLDALANSVVARECDCDEADSSAVVERTVLVALYHTHAPLLAEAGLVEFDPDEQSVALTELGREIQPLDG